MEITVMKKANAHYTHERSHWEFSNGNAVWIDHEAAGAHVEDEHGSVDSAWENVSYVATRAFDFKDVITLFVDGGSVIALWRLHVPFVVIAVIFGIVFGLWLLKHKK